MTQTDTSSRPIPALWVIVGVPLATIVASAITVWLAISGAEPELPAYYHSEGLELDADLARARRAAELGMRAELAVSTDGAAAVALRFDSPAVRAPDEIELRLTHATLADRDRTWRLRRSSDGLYRGRTAALGDGPWLVQIDAGDDWRLRGRLTDTTERLRLGAATP
jgi:hypothetical protein